MFSRAPHAGDRAPDACCHLANAGETTTLFDQFRGPHYTLLLFAGLTPKDVSYSQLTSVARQVGGLFGKEVEIRIIASANARPAALHWDGAMLLDSNQEVHKLYGAKAQSLYLVRPDGYIGFRAQPAAAEPLPEYLSSLFSLDNVRSYWEDPENTSAASNTLQRELRVMFSRSRSPVTLRLAKGIVFLSLARQLYGTRWFWMWALGSPLVGVATHLLYRHKIRGWTRPWGGWKNAKTPNPKESS